METKQPSAKAAGLVFASKSAGVGGSGKQMETKPPSAKTATPPARQCVPSAALLAAPAAAKHMAEVGAARKSTAPRLRKVQPGFAVDTAVAGGAN